MNIRVIFIVLLFCGKLYSTDQVSSIISKDKTLEIHQAEYTQEIEQLKKTIEQQDVIIKKLKLSFDSLNDIVTSNDKESILRDSGKAQKTDLIAFATTFISVIVTAILAIVGFNYFGFIKRIEDKIKNHDERHTDMLSKTELELKKLYKDELDKAREEIYFIEDNWLRLEFFRRLNKLDDFELSSTISVYTSWIKHLIKAHHFKGNKILGATKKNIETLEKAIKNKSDWKMSSIRRSLLFLWEVRDAFLEVEDHDNIDSFDHINTLIWAIEELEVKPAK